MLTVWRNLHVETDSMNAEPTTVDGREPDWQEVFIEDITVNAETTTLHLAGPLSGHSPHQFEGGRVTIVDNGWTLAIRDHTNDTIEINRVLTPPEWSYVEDHSAVVKDDDPTDDLLPQLFTMTPFIKNAYADAYIDIVDLDEQYNPNRYVEFDLYITWIEMVSGLGWNNSKDQDSSSNLWTTFVVAAYQAGGDLVGAGDRDNDPDPLVDNSTYPLCPCWAGEEYNETLQFGWTASFGDWDGIVFRAAIIDFPMHAHYENQVIAHEIGHSAGNTGDAEQHHGEGGLMSGSLTDEDNSFTAPTLKRFREAEKW
jgi:hypothetical protein